MYDSRNNLANDVSGQLASHFGDDVYRTIIPRNVTLAEAPSHGLPVMLYDAYSRGALAYQNLASELLERNEGSEAPASGGRNAVIQAINMQRRNGGDLGGCVAEHPRSRPQGDTQGQPAAGADRADSRSPFQPRSRFARNAAHWLINSPQGIMQPVRAQAGADSS